MDPLAAQLSAIFPSYTSVDPAAVQQAARDEVVRAVKAELRDAPRRPRPSTDEKLPQNYASAFGKVWFLPYLDSTTNDSPAIRTAMRQMRRDPYVKAAWTPQVLTVASEDWQIQASEQGHPLAEDQADFVKRVLEDYTDGGMPHVVSSICEPMGSDGFCLAEKVMAAADRGRLAGKVVLKALKARDTTQAELRIDGDEFGNVRGVQSLRDPKQTRWPIQDFVYGRYRTVFDEPLGEAAFRPSYGAYWHRDTVRKLRVIHHEKKNAGFLVGTYVDDDDKGHLESVLRNARASTWAAIPDGVKLDAINLSTASEPDYASFDESLRDEIVTGIAFATLQVIQGNVPDARGDSKVQKATADLGPWLLMVLVQECVNKQVIPDLIDFNYPFPAGGGYPKLTFGSISNAELLEQVQLVQQYLQLGFKPSKRHYAKTLSVQEADPEDPDDALGGQQPPGGTGGPPGMGGPGGGGTPPLPPGGGGGADPFGGGGVSGGEPPPDAFAPPPDGQSAFAEAVERFAWVEAPTRGKSGVKAVWQGDGGRRRPLYGERARKALAQTKAAGVPVGPPAAPDAAAGPSVADPHGTPELVDDVAERHRADMLAKFRAHREGRATAAEVRAAAQAVSGMVDQGRISDAARESLLADLRAVEGAMKEAPPPEVVKAEATTLAAEAAAVPDAEKPSWVRQKYAQFAARYGENTAKAIIAAWFLPLPGSGPAAVAIGEAVRAVGLGDLVDRAIGVPIGAARGAAGAVRVGAAKAARAVPRAADVVYRVAGSGAAWTLGNLARAGEGLGWLLGKIPLVGGLLGPAVKKWAVSVRKDFEAAHRAFRGRKGGLRGTASGGKLLGRAVLRTALGIKWGESTRKYGTVLGGLVEATLLAWRFTKAAAVGLALGQGATWATALTPAASLVYGAGTKAIGGALAAVSLVSVFEVLDSQFEKLTGMGITPMISAVVNRGARAVSNWVLRNPARRNAAVALSQAVDPITPWDQELANPDHDTDKRNLGDPERVASRERKRNPNAPGRVAQALESVGHLTDAQLEKVARGKGARARASAVAARVGRLEGRGGAKKGGPTRAEAARWEIKRRELAAADAEGREPNVPPADVAVLRRAVEINARSGDHDAAAELARQRRAGEAFAEMRAAADPLEVVAYMRRRIDEDLAERGEGPTPLPDAVLAGVLAAAVAMLMRKAGVPDEPEAANAA